MTDDTACGTGYEKLPVGRLGKGELGVLLARAGAGKTAVLTHLALGYILDREAVLHVCVDVTPDKVKLWYSELLRDTFSAAPQSKLNDLQHEIEPLRFIMSFLNQTFSPEKLETSIENLKSQAKFDPARDHFGRSGLWAGTGAFRKNRGACPKAIDLCVGFRKVSPAHSRRQPKRDPVPDRCDGRSF